MLDDEVGFLLSLESWSLLPCFFLLLLLEFEEEEEEEEEEELGFFDFVGRCFFLSNDSFLS